MFLLALTFLYHFIVFNGSQEIFLAGHVVHLCMGESQTFDKHLIYPPPPENKHLMILSHMDELPWRPFLRRQVWSAC